MEKKTIWTLGAIAFILICLCCMFFKIPKIEDDLLGRTRTALSKAGIEVENLSIKGRSLTMAGFVKSAEVKENAGSIAKNIWGVSLVSNELKVRQPKVTTKTKQVEIVQKKLDETIKLENIQFETGKEIIKSSSYPLLNKVVKILKENPNISINIDGHTDSTGDETFNKILSKKRAEAVKEHLVKNGINTNKLIAIGYGSSKPIADNNTKEGRKKNRRVEFKIIKEK